MTTDCLGPPRTVLVVDDDQGMRDSLEVILDISGFKTLQAPNAEAALAMLAQACPDLIILDANLPGRSGEEAAALIRSGNAGVVILGMSTEDRRNSMLQAGATDFMEKPFDPQALIRFIKDALHASPHR